MKRNSIILILLACAFNINSVLAQTMVVTDPGAYQYFNGLDKKAQEQLEFLQRIQDGDLAIKSTLSGNKRIGYGINSNMISYDEFFQIRNVMFAGQANQTTDKPTAISKSLDLIFPPIKVKIPNVTSGKQDNSFVKKAWQQNNIKTSIIFAEMMLSSSKTRISQIASLANDIDSTTTVKEAMDVNSRLILELIVETRNVNLLLANLIKIQSSKDFEGLVTPDYSQDGGGDVEDLIRGRSALGASMSKSPLKSGKFTNNSK